MGHPVLLCGSFPKDPFCSINILIDSAAPLLDIEAETVINNAEDLKAKCYRSLGIDIADSVEEAQTKTRDRIHEFFVDGRSMFLESMQDGLSLGGELDFPGLLGLIPPQAVKNLFFSRQTISVDHLFGVLEFHTEDLSHLTNKDYRERVTRKFNKLADKHNGLFQVKLHDALSKRAGEDSTFLNKFVHYCTGQAYLPDAKVHKDFRITLEFNHTECRDDHLPSVHTCDKLIKIPATCYGLKMDVFLQKLETAMEMTQFGFDNV